MKSKFERVYNLVREDILCPVDCNICENGWIQFLPGEIEFLSHKVKIPKSKIAKLYKMHGKKVWMRLQKDSHCPFFNLGRCSIRKWRPMDCRSFPVVPKIIKNKIVMELCIRCPLVKKGEIKNTFIRKANEAWKIINPPRWWLKIWNEIYLKEYRN